MQSYNSISHTKGEYLKFSLAFVTRWDVVSLIYDNFIIKIKLSGIFLINYLWLFSVFLGFFCCFFCVQEILLFKKSYICSFFMNTKTDTISSCIINHSCLNRKWLVSATSIETGQPVRPCSLTRLYTVHCPSSFCLDIPKMIMDSSKYRSWIIPFK